MKSFINEIKFQLLKSWLQILKVAGLLLTPMIYVIVLVFSVWQPLSNLNKAPIAIIDTSEKAYMYSNEKITKETLTTEYELGIILDSNGEMVKADKVSIDDIKNNFASYSLNVKDENGYIKFDENTKFDQIQEISFFDMLVNTNILHKNDNGTYSTQMIGSIKFENIKYFSGEEAVNRKHSSKDMVQLVIKDEYLMKDINFLGSILMKDGLDNNELQIEPLEVISNSSHNFILSYLADNVMQYKESVILDLFFAAFKGMSVNDKLLNWLVTIAEEFKDMVSDSLIQMNNDGTPKTRDFSFGLGEFFILIGVSVGILAQVLLFKRKPLYKYKSWLKYYFDKWALMNLTTFVQVGIIFIVLAMTPINQIGVFPLFLLWIWLSLFGVVFTTICTTVWMISKIELVGLFLLVSFLVLNIAAGSGVFPTYLQSWFYDLIGYVMPFKYAMKGEGVIIYSIGGLNHSAGAALEIVKQLIYLIPFIVIALIVAFVSSFRLKEYKYGTYSKKVLLQAVNDLNLTKHNDLINNLKLNNWTTLDDVDDIEIIKNHIENNIKKEKVFNWVK